MVNGFFSGGFAKGQQSAFSEMRAQEKQDQAFLQQGVKLATDGVKSIQDTVLKLKKGGATTDQIRKVTDPMVRAISPAARVAGMDMADIDNRINAIIDAAPGPKPEAPTLAQQLLQAAEAAGQPQSAPATPTQPVQVAETTVPTADETPVAGITVTPPAIRAVNPNADARRTISSEVGVAEGAVLPPVNPPPIKGVVRHTRESLMAAAQLAALGKNGEKKAIELLSKDLERQRRDPELGRFETFKDKLQAERDMRKEYLAAAKDFIIQRDGMGRIFAARDDAQGDLTLVFNFMKLLDPRSVVRESEFANAENTRGVPETIRQQFNRLRAGERLSAEQRSRFKKQSAVLFRDALNKHRLRVGVYTDLAKRNDLDPEDVAVDIAGDWIVLPDGTAIRRK